ncbi:hypothetical protein ACEPPN_004321 [Leptodophora sp. 'Broadleaf-Isolate-01']
MDTAMGVMGLGILITAIIFQSQGRLDLFHGICVFNLVSLVGFAIQPKTGKEVKDHKFKDLLYFAGYLLFLAYSIQLFATAPTFGSSPDCNDTVVLVILGVKFPATQVVLRWMIVVMLTLLAGSVAVAWFLSPTFYGSTSGPNWPVAIEELAARAYLVSNLELTIRYNNVAEGLGEWSFGQIMAMVLLLGPLVDFLTGLIYPESVEEPDYYSSNGTNKYIKKISKIFWLTGIIVTSIDLLGCTAAGAATAVVGARMNGMPVTAQVASFGALAGAIKSGVRAFGIFVSLHTSSYTTLSLKFLLLPVGLAFFVTNAIAQRIFWPVPDGLLIAAAAAGGPMLFGSLELWGGGTAHSITQFFELRIQLTPFPGEKPYPATLLRCMTFDIVSALVFVKVSSNHGLDISSFRGAVVASVVFCVLYWIMVLVPIRTIQNWSQRLYQAIYQNESLGVGAHFVLTAVRSIFYGKVLAAALNVISKGLDKIEGELQKIGNRLERKRWETRVSNTRMYPAARNPW